MVRARRRTLIELVSWRTVWIRCGVDWMVREGRDRIRGRDDNKVLKRDNNRVAPFFRERWVAVGAIIANCRRRFANNWARPRICDATGARPEGGRAGSTT